MKIQYASDLHLEFYDSKSNVEFSQFVRPVADAEILCLAGDICCIIGNEKSSIRSIFAEFLKYCSINWKYIILINGNHEYYMKRPSSKWRYNYKAVRTIDELDSIIKSECEKYPNIHFLQKGYFDIPDTNIRILGCTLWSDVAGYDFSNQIQNEMSDYSLICYSNYTPLTVDTSQILFEEHVYWLYEALLQARRDSKRPVVVTHYMPLKNQLFSFGIYKDNKLNAAFATDLSELFEKFYEIVVWICGHSHMCLEYKYQAKTGQNIPILLNCKGYPNESITEYSCEKYCVI